MDLDKFKALLDDQYSWPDYYSFKFIIKSNNKESLIKALAGFDISENQSSKAKYTSITARRLIQSTEEVVAVYTEVSKIEGIISL